MSGTSALNPKRILIKLSGESLSGGKGFGFCEEFLKNTCLQLKNLINNGYEVAVLIGGGNFYRGLNNKNINQNTSDSIGMIATIMNGLMLNEMLRDNNFFDESSCLMSAIQLDGLVEKFNQEKAIKILQSKKILILSGGTGLPFFTTDTGAAIRAGQIKADCILKATQVDGIYSKDPKNFKDAIKFDTISYSDVIEKKLKIMDLSSLILLNDLKIPLYVFSLKDKIKDVLENKCNFTLVTHT